MSYSKEEFSKARDILKERTRKNKQTEVLRKNEVYNKCPEIEKIDMELRAIGAETVGLVLKKQKSVKESIEILKNKSLSLQEKRRSLLIENGFPENYLEEVFTCPYCKDKGYKENSEMCECLKAILKRLSFEKLNDSISLEGNNFESFSLDFYSKDGENSPYSIAALALNYSKNYARDFSKSSESVIFMGKTGLGKTHLSLSIASEVIKKGYGVMYSSAGSLFSKIESEKFSPAYSESHGTLENAIKCDLLIIDDLGTEFGSPFTRSALYEIINSRLSFKKPTIINTNLSPKELMATYQDRITSRILSSYKSFQLLGNDIRIIKALKK